MTAPLAPLDHRVEQHLIATSPRPAAPLLTIGMAVHDDYAGVAFTIMNIVLNHPEILPDVEFLVVDNNPGTPESEDCRTLVAKLPRGRYCCVSPYKGTLVKNQVIYAAQTEYVLCVDSHVLLDRGSLRKLILFLRSLGPGCNDLFHGPLIDEQGRVHATHMNPLFSNSNFGRWGTYQGAQMQDPDMYRVPLHGMGLFCVRRDSWAGYHTAMHHFGSEEGYIHEKYRLRGDDCWALPFLKWWHLFRSKSTRINYPASSAHKFRNLLIAWTEVGLPLDFVELAFVRSLPNEQRAAIREHVQNLRIQPLAVPKGHVPFLGYPIRNHDAPYHESESYREFEKPSFYTAPEENQPPLLAAS